MRYNGECVIDGFTAGGTGQYKFRMFVDGDTAFCLEPGVPLHTGDTLVESSSEAWDSLTTEQQKAVGLALLYGYQGNRANLPGSDDEIWLGTQTLVWEFVTGCRNATGDFAQTSQTVYQLHFGSNYPNEGAVWPMRISSPFCRSIIRFPAFCPQIRLQSPRAFPMKMGSMC